MCISCVGQLWRGNVTWQAPTVLSTMSHSPVGSFVRSWHFVISTSLQKQKPLNASEKRATPCIKSSMTMSNIVAATPTPCQLAQCCSAAGGRVGERKRLANHSGCVMGRWSTGSTPAVSSGRGRVQARSSCRSWQALHCCQGWTQWTICSRWQPSSPPDHHSTCQLLLMQMSVPPRVHDSTQLLGLCSLSTA